MWYFHPDFKIHRGDYHENNKRVLISEMLPLQGFHYVHKVDTCCSNKRVAVRSCLNWKKAHVMFHQGSHSH